MTNPDLTKPVQTKCGDPMTIIATGRTDGPDGCSVVALNKDGDLLWYHASGRSHYRYADGFDLINVPEPESLTVTITMTVGEAARVALWSEKFCKAVGIDYASSYDTLLAHFTALAEQQRGNESERIT